MSLPRHQEHELTRYLLGEGSPEERNAVELRYLDDPTYLEALEATEEDLIDNHRAGRLSPSDKELFEKHYLSSPARRHKAESARTLVALLSHPRARSHWMQVFSAIAATTVLAVGIGWWFRDNQGGPSVVSVLLVTQTRASDAQINTVTLPRGAETLRVHCTAPVDDASQISRVSLRDPDEALILTGAIKVVGPPGRLLVEMSFPARKLPSGDYILQIDRPALDAHPLASFSLHIVRPEK